jgi:biopolymer transport protein ExbD
MGMMSGDQQDEGINDINITPFVDVVLVLLVIFMVTAPMMIKEGMNVNLPSATSSDQMNKEQLSISILKTGQILLNGQLMTQEALYESVVDLARKNNQLQGIISADIETKHGDVVGVMDQLKKAGLKKLAFQIIRQEK